MLSSAVRTFSNPDEYSAAIRAASVELTEIGAKQFSAKLARIDLHRLWMQRFWESAPRIKHSAHTPGRAIISFLTQPGPQVVTHGVAMPPASIVRHSPGQTFYQRSSGAFHMGSMSLPAEEMGSVSILAGYDLVPPREALLVRPSLPAMARLLRLHAVVGWLAEDAPEIIAAPQAAHGLEQSLIQAMAYCLQGEVRGERLASRHHELIMRRFRRVLEENPDQAIHIPELCAKIGVAERTLRLCCQEQLGVGPKRYLLLRRMHLSRRALELAGPTETTVTEVATRYGFWQFGRFASEYKSLYGETPSATLRRASF